LRDERAGLYRPVVPSRIPRSVPDEEFNEIFARLPSRVSDSLCAGIFTARYRKFIRYL
jgi:hypothetical protein